MSEDVFIKAMAKAYEQHPGAKVSSNFCWSLFKDGAETKDAEIERLRAQVRHMETLCMDKDKLITELADALRRAVNILSDQGHCGQTLDELSEPLQQAREATKDE